MLARSVRKGGIPQTCVAGAFVRLSRAVRAARTGPLQQQLLFASVARKRGGALELSPGLLQAPEFEQQVTAHALQEMVSLERGLRAQCIDETKARCRSERHAHRDRTVQLNHR